jgi:hypothetical protein
MYNKLFTKILDSSIWLEPNPTRIVWITFLAAMDEDGFAQFSSVRNLANRAMVTDDDAIKAVETLEAPDPDSNNKSHEGRRIERVPGGWMILNHAEHRAMVTRAISRDQTRVRVAKHRAKSKVADLYPKVVEFYGGLCAYCGVSPGVEMDHVIPTSRGGTHEIGNLVPACKPCNSSKKNTLRSPIKPHPWMCNADVTPSEAVSEADAHSMLRSSSVGTLSTSYSDRANGRDVLTKRPESEKNKRQLRQSMAGAVKGMP